MQGHLGAIRHCRVQGPGGYNETSDCALCDLCWHGFGECEARRFICNLRCYSTRLIQLSVSQLNHPARLSEGSATIHRRKHAPHCFLFFWAPLLTLCRPRLFRGITISGLWQFPKTRGPNLEPMHYDPDDKGSPKGPTHLYEEYVQNRRGGPGSWGSIGALKKNDSGLKKLDPVFECRDGCHRHYMKQVSFAATPRQLSQVRRGLPAPTLTWKL